MSLTYKTVVERIAAAREGRNWSQRDLGEKLYNKKNDSIGVSSEVVSRIERAEKEISVKDLIEIANTLGKPASWFLEDDDRKEEKSAPAPETSLYFDSVGDLIEAIEAFEHATQSRFVIETRPKNIYDREPVTVMMFDITENLATCLKDYASIRDGLKKSVPKDLLDAMLKTLKDHYSKILIDDTLKMQELFTDEQEGK